jgi:excisionase family DNA binding protein
MAVTTYLGMAKMNHLVEYKRQTEKESAEELRNHLHALVDFFVMWLAPAAKSSHRLALHEVLTADEIAEKLKVPRSTIEEMARAGKLPGAFRVGKHWRFDLDSVRTGLPRLDKEET